MKKKACLNFGTVCYVVAAVLAVITVYLAYANIAYITQYLTAYGMTFADMKGDIIQTVISACAPYFAYAFIVFGIGKVYNTLIALCGWDYDCDCDCGGECDGDCGGECDGNCDCEAEATEEAAAEPVEIVVEEAKAE